MTEDPETPRRLTLSTLQKLSRTTGGPDWLVDGVVARGQPLVAAGPPKSLKTSIILDLAVSLAAAVFFLGRFRVPAARRVAVISGESGRPVVVETARRVCRAKGVDPDKIPLHLGFRLPRLDRPADRAELARVVAARGAEVVVLDPLYLCLLSVRGQASAANLYDVGPILAETAAAVAEAGATLVLVHHTTKAAGRKEGRLPTLLDLSFAGVAEFARQWVLLGRPGGYDPGSGRHDLVVAVGGSAGHSSAWDLRVDEGPAGGPRRWAVRATPYRPGG